jgi:hypothetical protein
MSKVTAKEFSKAVDTAIMERGSTGINHVLTQFMFGEHKFLNGLVAKADQDQDRITIINQLVYDIKCSYQEGGLKALHQTVERLIEKSAAQKSGFEVL